MARLRLGTAETQKRIGGLDYFHYAVSGYRWRSEEIMAHFHCKIAIAHKEAYIHTLAYRARIDIPSTLPDNTSRLTL